MANSNVIKEFLVSLGFSTDEKALDNFKSGIKRATVSVVELATAIEGTAIAVAAGVARFASNLETLYFASQRTGASVAGLKALGRAAQDFGASSEDAMSAAEGLAKFLRSNPGGAAFIAGAFGTDVLDAQGQMTDQSLVKIGKSMAKMPVYLAEQYASMLGMSDKMMLALRNGDYEKDFNRERAKYANAGIDKAAERAHQFKNDLRDLGDQLTIFAVQVENVLSQRLGISVRHLTELFQKNGAAWASQIASFLGYFIDEFSQLITWLETHAHEINTIMITTFTEIKGAYDLIKPALSWIFESLVKLDGATDGWSTKMIVALALLQKFGLTSMLVGIVQLTAAFIKLGAGLAGVVTGGAGLGGLLASVGAASAGAVAGVIALGGAIGYLLGMWADKRWNISSKLGEWMEDFAQWFNKQTGAAAFQSTNDPAKRDWVIKQFESLGWTHNQAAGLAVNAQAESGFNPNAENKGHLGMFQWDPERWDRFTKYADMNHMEATDPMAQIKFADYELRFGTEKAAGRLLQAANSSQDAAFVGSHFYERPGSGLEDIKRSQAAATLNQETTINVNAGHDGAKLAREIADAHRRATQDAYADLTREFAAAMQ